VVAVMADILADQGESWGGLVRLGIRVRVRVRVSSSDSGYTG
jgi:hypothetical protein